MEANTTFDQIPAAILDNEGTFKYIQIDLKEGDQHRTIVRGYASCGYHADILNKFQIEETKTY